MHLDMLYAVADCPRWENDTLVRSKTLGRITARELGQHTKEEYRDANVVNSMLTLLALVQVLATTLNYPAR